MKNELKEIIKRLKANNFDTPQNKVWTLCRYALMNVYIAVAAAEEYDMTNKQFYISFEDELNELSVRDHTKPLMMDDLKKAMNDENNKED